MRASSEELQNYICPECGRLIKETTLRKRRELGGVYYCVDCYLKLKRQLLKERKEYILQLNPEQLIELVNNQ